MGYWLYDYLVERGIGVIVTPPNWILTESGRRVKTNTIDSRKLALYLEKGMLKRVAVPSKQMRQHRNIVRVRRQLLRAQKALQSHQERVLSQCSVPFRALPWFRFLHCCSVFRESLPCASVFSPGLFQPGTCLPEQAHLPHLDKLVSLDSVCRAVA